MSKKQHRKQLERARARRHAARRDRRRGRTRVISLVMVALLVLGLVGAGLAGLLGAGEDPVVDDLPEEDLPEDPPAAAPCPPDDDAPAIDSDIYDEPPLADVDPDTTYVATVATTCGDFEIDLDVAGAPIATGNFIGLARDGYYDGVEFHRVINGFVIQVGDPAGTGCGQEDCTPEGFDPDAPTYPGYTFEDELETAEAAFEEGGLGYPRGTVAMANSGPDTNGSQFFVAQGEPTGLPGPDFTVLGEVVSGMDVVDQIAGQATDVEDRPTEPVRIVSVTIDEN